MKKQTGRRLEWVILVTSWITVGGTAVWTLLLPWRCNLKLNLKTHYGAAPWGEVLGDPAFWRMLVLELIPAAAVLLVMGQGLALLARVRRGELFCARNVGSLRTAGAAGLAMALYLALRLAAEGKLAYLELALSDLTAAVLVLEGWLSELLQFGFCLMGGLFCLLLAQFLRRGMELQEDSDLTI